MVKMMKNILKNIYKRYPKLSFLSVNHNNWNKIFPKKFFCLCLCFSVLISH